MLLTFLSTAGAVPASCLKPKPNECGFYRECLEEKYHCGDSGYPLAYGEKYCHRFNSLNESNLSPEGLKWRDATLVCLQEDLVGRLLSPSYVANCDQLKQVAYNSHPRCYTQPGNSICDLSPIEWAKIGNVVDGKDFFTVPSAIQMKEVLKTCNPRLYKMYRILTGEKEKVAARMLFRNLQASMNADTTAYENDQNDDMKQFMKIENEIKKIKEKLEYIEQLEMDI